MKENFVTGKIVQTWNRPFKWLYMQHLNLPRISGLVKLSIYIFFI